MSNEIVGYRNRWDNPRYRGKYSVSEDPCHTEDGTSDPLVLKSDLDTALARIAELEAKLAEAEKAMRSLTFTRYDIAPEFAAQFGGQRLFVVDADSTKPMRKFLSAIDAEGGDGN